MLERFSWYVALLAAVGFGVLQGSLFIQKVRSGVALAEPGYINFGNVLIAAVAVWIAIRGLKRAARDARTGVTREATFGRVSETSFLEDVRSMPDTYRRAFRQRPKQLTVLMGILAALPIGLWTLATGRGPSRFGLTDWMLVGFAELPIVVAIGLMIRGLWNSRPP